MSLRVVGQSPGYLVSNRGPRVRRSEEERLLFSGAPGTLPTTRLPMDSPLVSSVHLKGPGQSV